MKPFMTGGNGVRYLTRKNIEQISERVLRAYWKLPDALLEPQRVVPDVLLESLLGLTISFRHLSIDRCTLGLTCFHEIGIEIYDDPSEDFFMMDGKSVLIETDLNEPYASVGRRNFTVMHEGCHHILHMLFPFDCDYGMSARRVLKYRMTGYKRSSMDVAEWQTDAVVISYNGDADLTLTTFTEETHGDPHANVADDIFFSKYFEAAANVKLLAIFNGTFNTVDLSNYQANSRSSDVNTYNNITYSQSNSSFLLKCFIHVKIYYILKKKSIENVIFL